MKELLELDIYRKLPARVMNVAKLANEMPTRSWRILRVCFRKHIEAIMPGQP
jgi:hypothetical protein